MDDLEVTVRTLARRLLGYCVLRTGDPVVAEDVAQEALSALVQRWRRYGPPDSPDAFVFAIARRRAARAALKRRLWLPLEVLRHQRDGAASDPESLLAQHEDRTRVVTALAGIGRRDRDLLLLVTVAGVSMRDAAATAGISISAAKMRCLRARQRMRELLENGNAIRRP